MIENYEGKNERLSAFKCPPKYFHDTNLLFKVNTENKLNDK